MTLEGGSSKISGTDNLDAAELYGSAAPVDLVMEVNSLFAMREQLRNTNIKGEEHYEDHFREFVAEPLPSLLITPDKKIKARIAAARMDRRLRRLANFAMRGDYKKAYAIYSEHMVNAVAADEAGRIILAEAWEARFNDSEPEQELTEPNDEPKEKPLTDLELRQQRLEERREQRRRRWLAKKTREEIEVRLAEIGTDQSFGKITKDDDRPKKKPRKLKKAEKAKKKVVLPSSQAQSARIAQEQIDKEEARVSDEPNNEEGKNPEVSSITNTSANIKSTPVTKPKPKRKNIPKRAAKSTFKKAGSGLNKRSHYRSTHTSNDKAHSRKVEKPKGKAQRRGKSSF